MLAELPFDCSRSTRILGSKGAGKTRRLINSVAEYLGEGGDPCQIVVVCATPTAATRFAECLHAACGNIELVARVRVTTARQWALEILDCPEAYAATGRRARMIAPFEKAFVLEDVKTCGMRPKRLKEMLKFLERGWTEFSDEDPDWLIGDEEKSLQDFYRGNLAFYEAMIEPEICNMALKYLKHNSDALRAARVNVVLVDDFQLMNRTSQLLTCLLAQKHLVVTVDSLNTAPVFDLYPYAAGIEELEQWASNTETQQLGGCKREEAIVRITQSVIANGTMQESLCGKPTEIKVKPGDFQLLTASTPKREFQKVSAWVADLISQGINPQDIAVVHPGVSSWGNYAIEALRAAGFKVQAYQDVRTLGGDVRNLASCEAMQLASLILLAGQRDDSMAWRCWCGYGDWLTSSAVFDKLRRYASYKNLNLYQTLDLVAKHQLTLDRSNDVEVLAEGLETVLSRYESAIRMLERVQGMKGFDLIRSLAEQSALGDKACSRVEQFCGGFTQSMDVSAICNALRNALTAPALSRCLDAVCVGPFGVLCGLNPQAVLVVGMVNGFFPDGDYFNQGVTTIDKQTRILQQDTARFYVMACSAERIQAFSWFKQIEMNLAYKMKLKIERIGLKSGQKVASLSPSKFLDLVPTE